MGVADPGGTGSGGTGEQAFADLERELSLLLRRARAFSGETARRVHPELDAVSYMLLRTVHEQEPVRASELAELFRVDKSSISRQVHRLEQLQLVARTEDRADARARLLVVTEEGRERLAVAMDGRRAIFRRGLADWAPGDVARLAELLRRYNAPHEDRPEQSPAE